MIQKIYNKAKNSTVEEFIFSYKENYLELLWNNSPYVIANPLCYYFDRTEFEEIIRDKKKRLESLLSENIKEEFIRRNEIYEAYVTRFEKNLTMNEKEQVFFLLDYLQKIDKWNPDTSELKLIRNSIAVEFQICINTSYDENYVYAKLYTIAETERCNKMEIEATKKEIELFENHIKFRNEFNLKENEYLNDFKVSLLKDLNV
jgi:hypothetical protein